jgi:hypothetical protein
MSSTTTATRPRRKAIYHIRNWSAYDRALVQRGSLTAWIKGLLLLVAGFMHQSLAELLTINSIGALPDPDYKENTGREGIAVPTRLITKHITTIN